MSHKHTSSTDDDDSDYNDRDPGREVIEKNIRNRLKRIADYTKEELNKVLKRVDKTLDNYEYSVQSSLIQHGMTHDDMSNVEHVADIKELEDLLNDSLAKQRYKQRLMIFIVGQTEQASEKAKLLQQIGQFFYEQKQNFSSSEFNISDDINEKQDEIDRTLKSFDVKDCYIHVKTLGTRLTELNDEIVQYLIQNAGTKQQAKGRKKLAQVAKETKDQLINLQSKLEIANTEMINRDNRIEILEKEIEKLQNETKLNQNKLNLYETGIESYKSLINELEDNIQEYKNQINNLTIHQSEIKDKEIQTSYHSEEIPSENIEDVNVSLIDLNLPTEFPNPPELAIVRIRELLKELEIKESINNEIVQKFDEYKKACEKEQNDWIEKTDHAYQLQIKAQKTAEEAINHLQFYMAEQDKFKPDLIHQETQTTNLIFQNEHEILNSNISPSEQINPIEESFNDNLSSQSKITTEEFESIENFRQTSLKEKCILIIEEKKYELDQLKQQAEIILSRPTSLKEQIELQSLENIDVPIKRQPSISSFDSIDQKKNQPDIELIIKQDQEQQTSFVNSRHSSIHEEKIMTEMIPNDQFKHSFYHLYEIIYKFRHSIINLLEQNNFLSLGNCLQMIKQLSIDDNNKINDFIANAEHLLKDIIKVFQTCIKTLQTTTKENEIIKEPEIIIENSLIDNQQSLIIDQKDSIIIDLSTKYEEITKILNQVNKKYQEESNLNERLIINQQKLIQNLQQETFRLQKRLTKIEYDGIIEPSVMFTRRDAERNDETLQQAVSKGKVPETTYNELNEVMTDYVELPSEQFSNLVKRYIHFRKATAIEDRIQSEILDNDTKNVLQKMELLYERRSDQIRKHMSNIRQHRANLARILTEKFDQLDDESSIFLIRPVYSYQGRAATQSYMKHVKHRREVFLNEHVTMKKHNPSRQSVKTQSAKDGNQKTFAPLSPVSTTYDEGRLFHIEKSLSSPRPSLVEQQNDSNDTKHITVQLSELTRLEELDFQRALLPMSHATTPLLSAFTNDGIDPCVPSLNLRSYVALSRPSVSHVRMEKRNEIIKPVSREGLSASSAKSQRINPPTPSNSRAGDIRRVGPPLPPIKRSLTLSVSPIINEIQHSNFVPAVHTNEVSTGD